MSHCQFTISFPKNSEILVKEKEEVKKDELLLRYLEEEFFEYDLSASLNLPAKQISRFLAVGPKSKIKKGQIIASKKSLFGRLAEITSPVDGEIDSVSAEGILKIKTRSEKKEIRAPFAAKISEIGDIFLILEFEGQTLTAEKGFGKDVCGPLFLLTEEREKETEIARLTTEQKDKIILLPGKVSQGLFHKAEALGIKGIIAGGLDDQMAGGGQISILCFGAKDDQVPIAIWQDLIKNKDNPVCLYGQEKILAIPQK
jgi:hypothetical protein